MLLLLLLFLLRHVAVLEELQCGWDQRRGCANKLLLLPPAHSVIGGG